MSTITVGQLRKYLEDFADDEMEVVASNGTNTTDVIAVRIGPDIKKDHDEANDVLIIEFQ